MSRARTHGGPASASLSGARPGGSGLGDAQPAIHGESGVEQGGQSAHLTLRFRPPPLLTRATFWTLVTVVALAFGVGSGLWARFSPGSAPDGWLDRALGIAALAACAIAAFTRGKTAYWQVPPLEVFDDHLSLPKNAASKRSVRVGHADMLSLEVVGAGDAGKLVIGTRRGLHVYPVSSLAAPLQLESLRSAVLGQIAGLEAGAALLERMQRRETFGEAARVRPVRVTWVLMPLLALGFAVEYFSGALQAPLGLLPYGVNAPALVAAGQVERLFSANFLHANLVHLLTNAGSLLSLGVILERLIGSTRFSLTYLCSALGGAALSALLGHSLYSVGASSAIFGLLGALALLQARFGLDLPTGFRQPPLWWLLLFGLNALLPVFVQQIDVAAHVGGFVAGAAVAAVSCPSVAALRSLQVSRVISAAAFALSLLCVAALARVALERYPHAEEDRERLAEALIHESENADALNAVGWHWAVDAGATHAQLLLARRAVERALSLQPDRHELLDSFATACHRLGDFDRAVEHERRAYRVTPQRFYHSQVARFLFARWQQSGPLHVGRAGEPAAAEVELSKRDSVGQQRAELQLQRSYGSGAELWVLAEVDGVLVGSGLLRLGPTDAGASRLITLDQLPDAAALRLHVALIDLDACASCARESSEWRYEAMDPAALALP